MYPSGVDQHSTRFLARLRDDSLEWAAVNRVLAEAGCRAHTHGERYEPGQFSLQPNYEYDKADFARADYFQMLPQQDVESSGARSAEGVLYVQRAGLNRKGPLVLSDPLAVLVSSHLRAAMESAGFIGLAFRRTGVRVGRYQDELKEVSWERVGRDPYWEIAPTITLPPLSPRCRLVDGKTGTPITDDDWSHGVMLVEDELPAGELHYRQADIRMVEPLDFAMTHEPLAYGRGSRLVVSRRVYDWVRGEHLRACWTPVFVDAE